MFAVCDTLNERVILTADTVQNLELMEQYNVLSPPEVAATSMANVVTNETDGMTDSDGGEDSGEDDIICLDGSSKRLTSEAVGAQLIDPVSDGSTQNSSVLETPEVIIEEGRRTADFLTLHNEQLADPALKKYWEMAYANKNGFFVQDGLLYHRGQVQGEKVTQLCLPEPRIGTVLKISHDSPFGAHLAFRRTNERIALSFFFPGQRSRVKDYCSRCETCQLFAPARRSDLNVIEAIPRNVSPFGHVVVDCVGPLAGAGAQIRICAYRSQYAFSNGLCTDEYFC